MIALNIPRHAIQRSITCGNRKNGKYRIWYEAHPFPQWFWAALGNWGTANSEDEARTLAVRWIRDGC